MRPGGEEEGGRSWKDSMHQLRGGRAGQKDHQSNPPNCYIPLCKMGTAIVLPLCWGRNLRDRGGLFPGEKGHEDGFASPCPFPLFYSREGTEPAWVSAHCPEKPGGPSGSYLGSVETLGEEFIPPQLFLPSQHPCRQGSCDRVSCVILWLASMEAAQAEFMIMGCQG